MRLIPLLSTVAPVLALAMALGSPAPAQNVPASAANASANPSEATPPASLVADKIFISAERQLVAEGNVETFYGRTRLQARRITFSRDDGRLLIEGPIRIDQGGATTILANAAELDQDLQNGILRGAYMVFDQQVQLAALQMTRAEGRYTQLYKSTVTSCDVCEDGKAPIWAIRANRITHDQQERQLYLEGAQLRLLDVPVFYFPALRMPDPTLERATGFLVPSLSSNSNFGTGVKLPYFIKIGDHKDLTVTPFIANNATAVELRYRQAFRKGQIEVLTGLARDDIRPDDTRGRFYANGRFDLTRGYRLRFDLKTVSDEGYLADYDISDTDRLRSELTVLKTNRNKLVRAGLIRYESLRDNEPQQFVPTDIVSASYEKRLFPSLIGGELRFGVEVMDFNRSSGLDATADNANGRDMSRLTVDFDWRRQWILPVGLVAEGQIGLGIDQVSLSDDAVFENNTTAVTPRSAVTLRLPLQRRTASGDTQSLEPIFQIGWTNVTGAPIPNEASNISEFDQGNLLSLSRFPEADAREDGLSIVYGVNWQHADAEGWELNLSAGQVFRQDPDSRFSSTSGLNKANSDLLLAGQLLLRDELTLTARGLWDEAFDVSKAEIRGDWRTPDYSLRGSYLWLQQDSDENRDDETNEVWLDGTYALDGNWTAAANIRYDISDSRATRAGLGLTYQNECVTLNLSMNRRFTSTESVEPTTDFGFTLSLNGFSVKSSSKTYRRSCSTT